MMGDACLQWIDCFWAVNSVGLTPQEPIRERLIKVSKSTDEN